jgi:hypothetical protein
MMIVVNAEFAKSKQHHPKISLRFTGGNAPADTAPFDADDNGAAASLMRRRSKPCPLSEASAPLPPPFPFLSIYSPPPPLSVGSHERQRVARRFDHLWKSYPNSRLRPFHRDTSRGGGDVEFDAFTGARSVYFSPSGGFSEAVQATFSRSATKRRGTPISRRSENRSSLVLDPS